MASSLMCTIPSLPGSSSTNAPKSRRSHDLARVDLADLYLLGQIADHLFGAFGGFAVARTDDDRAVVLDIHSRAGLIYDSADRLAARPDNRADLVNRYLDRLHPRRVLAHLPAIRRKRTFDVLQDLLPGIARLVQRVVDHVVAYALDLHVQLYGCNPVHRSGDLEVHVAHVVFLALDVG